METIIVQFVAKHVYAETKKVSNIKYLVQFAGVSDKPSKLMRLQVWDMPFDTRDEANKTLLDYQEKMEKGSFVIIKGLKQ